VMKIVDYGITQRQLLSYAIALQERVRCAKLIRNSLANPPEKTLGILGGGGSYINTSGTWTATLSASTLPLSSRQALPVSRFRRIDALQIEIIEAHPDRRSSERIWGWPPPNREGTAVSWRY